MERQYFMTKFQIQCISFLPKKNGILWETISPTKVNLRKSSFPSLDEQVFASFLKQTIFENLMLLHRLRNILMITQGQS